MVSVVSAQEFYEAFFDQWNDDRKDNCEALREAYQDPDRTVWTDYMLGENRDKFKKKTFFHRLARKLRQEPIRERQNLDVVYYTEPAQNAPQDKDMPRPACFNVIIEHENDKDNVEKEMWKLLMWRAPLKVLVWYDRQAPGLDAKLRQLDALRQEVNREWPEADKTTYLFLVGQPQEGNELPLWWYSYCDSSEKTRRPLKPMRLKIVKSCQDSFGES